jgi:hypothetical protein
MNILPKKAYGLQHKAYSSKGSRVPCKCIYPQSLANCIQQEKLQ